MELGAHMGWFLMRWPREVREHLIREAERLGYGSVWTAESTGCDAATPLAAAATLTERVRIGAGVLQMPARTPETTARTAVSLDRLSGGRFLLGIGASTKPVTEDWHGQTFARQLARTREYVSHLRAELEGDTTDGPVQDRIPILLGAIGPRNVRLSGEIADGWISTMIPPERIAEDMVRVREAAEEADRVLPEDFHVVFHAMTSIDEDPAVARDRLRPMLTVYAGMGKPDRNLYRRLYDGLGFREELEVVTDHFQAGRVEEARAALPDAFIEMVTLCGTPEMVAERAAEYADAGVTSLMANFLVDDDDPEGWEYNLRTLGERAR